MKCSCSVACSRTFCSFEKVQGAVRAQNKTNGSRSGNSSATWRKYFLLSVVNCTVCFLFFWVEYFFAFSSRAAGGMTLPRSSGTDQFTFCALAIFLSRAHHSGAHKKSPLSLSQKTNFDSMNTVFPDSSNLLQKTELLVHCSGKKLCDVFVVLVDASGVIAW